MRITKAVIPAAGWGTRFLPITKSQPKEMLPIIDKPLIQYSLEDAVACGVDLVIIVTAPDNTAIEAYFSKSPELERVLEARGEIELLERVRSLSSMADIRYVRQNPRLGLGHAVLAARETVGQEPFILLLPDDLFEERDAVLRQMLEVCARYEGSVVATMRVSREETRRYGILKAREIAHRVHQVMDCIEKPEPAAAPSNLAIMGRYVLMADVFGALEEAHPGKNGEIQLTDALAYMTHRHPMYAYEFAGERYDVGTPLGWLKTTINFALRNPLFKEELARYLARVLQRVE